MVAAVKLPFHPTATDCLAWSEDGELAVAAGEFAHLLPQELSSLDNLSIGEEQSTGTVVALSWSPVGLAKHKRSALAILTTNHILSLWAPASDPKIPSTWERVLVINKALDSYFPGRVSHNADGETSGENVRHFTRIRSMSWAPPMTSDGRNGEVNSRKSPSEIVTRIQYLAITNDANGVAGVQIKSPWVHHAQSFWEAKVQFHATWDDLKTPFFSPPRKYTTQKDSVSTGAKEQYWPSTFADSLSEKTFIDRVNCVPCQTYESGLGMILRKDRQILQYDISYKVVSQASTFDQWMPLLSSAVELFSWEDPSAPKKNAYQSTFVEAETQAPQLIDEWDEISGLQKDFDHAHDLGGLSITKTWGLASWGPYLASCVTLHPGDMVEYYMPSRERCHIVFSREDLDADSQEATAFPWQEGSSAKHELDTQVILSEILAMASDSGMTHTSLDHKTMFSVCCAAVICSDVQNLQSVKSVLHDLYMSIGIGLELEGNLIDDIRHLDFYTTFVRFAIRSYFGEAQLRHPAPPDMSLVKRQPWTVVVEEVS
ncbi:MAG: hypothetical protein Q9179_006351 [Wetmoreana sp. 5 TL-2023]